MNFDLNWAVMHSRLAAGQPLVSRNGHFRRPTASRVQFGSPSRSVFSGRESSVSCRPTDLHNLGRSTANRAKFGSISSSLFSTENCRLSDGQPSASRHVQFGQPTANRVQFRFQLQNGVFLTEDLVVSRRSAGC